MSFMMMGGITVQRVIQRSMIEKRMINGLGLRAYGY